MRVVVACLLICVAAGSAAAAETDVKARLARKAVP